MEAVKYEVHQLMHSPRDQTWGSRFWESFDTEDEAKALAKKMSAAQVRKVELIAEYHDGKPHRIVGAI